MIHQGEVDDIFIHLNRWLLSFCYDHKRFQKMMKRSDVKILSQPTIYIITKIFSLNFWIIMSIHSYKSNITWSVFRILNFSSCNSKINKNILENRNKWNNHEFWHHLFVEILVFDGPYLILPPRGIV